MSEWVHKLNILSLKDFSNLFTSASGHNRSTPIGIYRASFVGPGWLRAAAGPALAVGGFSGWWGKRFNDDGTAVNLFQRGENLESDYPMRLIDAPSALDGKPALALIYGAENPFPWPYIVDELRHLDDATFLGMTYANKGALRKLAFPFLLEYQEQASGS